MPDRDTRATITASCTVAALGASLTTVRLQGPEMPDETHHIAAGDTKPAVRATLQHETDDGSFEPADLSDAYHVTFRMYERDNVDDPVISHRATIVDDPDAPENVRYEWRRLDTETPGVYNAVFEVRWPDGRETYPNTRPLSVRIHEQ